MTPNPPRQVAADPAGLKTRLILIRHGQTEWNAEGRMLGHAPVPLNDLGRAQAEAIGRRLRNQKIDAIYTSDLPRARETAAAIIANSYECSLEHRTEHRVGVQGNAPTHRPLYLEEGLREGDVGAWTGLDVLTVKARWPQEWQQFIDWAGGHRAPGGESLSLLQQRVMATITRIVARHPGQTVAVVTHAGPLQAYIGASFGFAPAATPWQWRADNGSLTIVEYYADPRFFSPGLVTLNDTCHLPKPAETGAAASSTRLYLTRHGQTTWNEGRRIQGQGDSPLNPLGQSQADRLAARLADVPFTAVYSSDLGRAMETASRLLNGRNLAIRPEPRLREGHYGEWEGMASQDVVARYAAVVEARRLNPDDVPPPGGETVRQLQTRVVAAWNAIIGQHGGSTEHPHPGEAILIVAHGGPLRSLVMYGLGLPPRAFWQLRSDNAALSVVEISATGATLLNWNDTCHLEEGQME